jgi:hypothetical protein
MMIPNKPGRYAVEGLRIIVTPDEIHIDTSMLLIAAPDDSAVQPYIERIPHPSERQPRPLHPVATQSDKSDRIWKSINRTVKGINELLMGKEK